MEKLTGCRIKTTRPALATGSKGKGAIMEKLTRCRIKTTRPASVTGSKRGDHGETHCL